MPKYNITTVVWWCGEEAKLTRPRKTPHHTTSGRAHGCAVEERLMQNQLSLPYQKWHSGMP